MLKKIGTSGIAIAAFLAWGTMAEAKTKVVIGELDWLGARAVEQVLNQVMTEYLDAEVSTIAASQPALYESMNKGDGSVDVVGDVWSDHLPAQMKNYVIPGSAETIIFNKTPYEGTEGIFIPKYVADEHGVKALADLAKPEVAKLFDADGNGLGELWAGAAGWESTNQTQVRAKSYGFDKTMELTTLDQAVQLALLKDAYASKKPIAFYYWTPEWIFAAYELVKLEEPPFTGYTTEEAKGTERYNADGCYTFYQPGQRNDWLEASDIKCHQPPTRVYVAHSKELAGRDPKIAQFLTQVTLSTDDVSKWILSMEVDGTAVETVAKEWIDANRAKIENEWLAGVR